MKKLFALFLVITIIDFSANAFAGWSPMTSGTTNDLRSIWGTSETNIYAVGYEGTILHYDGDGDDNGIPDDIWEKMISPKTGEEIVNRSIWGTSEINIYVVGL